MCIILIGKINESQFTAAKEQNPHGFSLFTEELGLVKAPTTSQVKAAIGKFGIWHFRIASSGVIDESNIHPFRVCHSKYFLYHNGVLGEGKGKLSDTAALAKTLQHVPVKTARTVLRSLAERQRFVLVKADDPTSFELFGNWTVSGGILMSHELRTYSIYSTGTYKTTSNGVKYGGVTTTNKKKKTTAKPKKTGDKSIIDRLAKDGLLDDVDSLY